MAKEIIEVPQQQESFPTGWYLTYLPLGSGGAARLFALELILQTQFGLKTYFPGVVVGEEKGKKLVKLLYPNYVFVHCSWSRGLEDELAEALPQALYFVKEEAVIYEKSPWGRGRIRMLTKRPVLVPNLDRNIIEELIDRIEKDSQLTRDFLATGNLFKIFRSRDVVRFVRGSLANCIGTVIEVKSNGKVLVEVAWESKNRTSTVSTDLDNLERV